MSAADRILSLVDRPKQVKPHQWMAGCPCCQSRRGRPLAISETANNSVLLHAFCGCDTEAVLGALGLTVTDLFDVPISAPPQRHAVPPREILAALSTELTFCALIANDMLERKTISEDDWNRLATAAQRLTAARDHVG